MQEQPSDQGSNEVAELSAQLTSDLQAAREELRSVADGIRAALAADDALNQEASK